MFQVCRQYLGAMKKKTKFCRYNKLYQLQYRLHDKRFVCKEVATGNLRLLPAQAKGWVAS